MPYQSVIIDAAKIVDHSHLGSGNWAADLGTGREGRFALAAARVVGPQGRVYAVDIVKSILPAVQNKASMYGLNNVVTVWSDLEIYGAAKDIIDQSLDVAFLATVLFQSENQPAIMREAVRLLKPGGRLVVVEWKEMNTPFGPALERRVAPAAVKQMAQQLNLQLIEELAAGQYHYCLIFQKSL